MYPLLRPDNDFDKQNKEAVGTSKDLICNDLW